MGTVTGRGRLAVHYREFALLENTYYVTIEICKNEYASSFSGTTYDCQNMKYELVVKSNRTDGGGIVRNPNRWKLMS